ncbi:hypothetical protein Amir_5101 [Actinosynnema mirum DSM 43827]|uniref:Uncharacterized protein n=1 Tax=Actinosynnema mirum (strain ATCC 29888 / DSM 43827 / JCM 3225 / NBRC 14064 / NCIMB 13271 / NRRL B-12336 / IMRU 3971 / 101) TaxID=446462 RepID=C6WSA3_ACTMD|nr:hypothetical protein Amir_5101 [Actinosynnema mirum DSM 43827]
MLGNSANNTANAGIPGDGDRPPGKGGVKQRLSLHSPEPEY